MSTNEKFMPDPEPIYTTRIKGDEYVIDVSISGRHFRFGSLTRQEKIRFFLREASKSPLKGMACIHKYARKKDPLALQLAALYAHYQTFLETHDPALVKTLDCNTELKPLLETLLPGFSRTLSSAPLQFIDPIQRIQVPEMQAPYNAFPDLIYYQGAYYLSFREARKHQGKHDLGKVRILKGRYESGNWSWENEALLESSYDLRDPKFFVDGAGELHLMIGGSVINKKGTEAMVPHVAFLKNNTWMLEQAQAPEGVWIWQVTWNGNAGYGFAYGPNNFKTLHLMKTVDGRTFKKIASIADSKLNLTESTIRFKKDGTAIALIRADPKTFIAHSRPDYLDWTLTPFPLHGGGQNFLPLKKGYLVTTRHLFLSLNNRVHERMLIAFLDEKEITPLQTLYSQIDTGYAGLVLEDDGSITLAYYSAEAPDKSHIYIAKVKLKEK